MFDFHVVEKFALLFENCEILDIPVNKITFFSASEPLKTVKFQDGHLGSQSMMFRTEYKNLKLSFLCDNPSKSRAVSYRDLVSVTIVYKDGPPRTIYPYWHEKDDVNNSRQSCWWYDDSVTIEVEDW